MMGIQYFLCLPVSHEAPVNPAEHWHQKYAVLWQVAPFLHGLVKHSFTLAETFIKQRNVGRTYETIIQRMQQSFIISFGIAN